MGSPDLPARASYFDRIAAKHPELAVPAQAPLPRPLPRPPFAPAGRLGTVLALAGIAAITVTAVRLGGLAAVPAAGVEPGVLTTAASVQSGDRGMVPVRIEVVRDPGPIPVVSTDEDVDAPVSLADAVLEPPPAGRRSGHSATATALAGGAVGGFQRAVKVFAPGPEYPEEAARRGQGGIVILAVRVDERGTVSAVDVRRSVDPALDGAAVEAVRRWLFTPASLDGRPVPDTVQTGVRFVPPTLGAPRPQEAARLQEAAPAPRPQGETRPATRLVSPLPSYPPSAWASGRSGDVTLDLTIGPDGRVAGVELVHGLGPTIDAAAIAAVRRWRFAPALENGVAVAATQRYSLRFAPQTAALEAPNG